MDHQAVYERLVQAARAREFVHCGAEAQMLGVGSVRRHGELTEDEVRLGRPRIRPSGVATVSARQCGRRTAYRLAAGKTRLAQEYPRGVRNIAGDGNSVVLRESS